MNLKDDLKAINLDLEKEKDLYMRTKKAQYWYVKLNSLYPDNLFTILYSGGNALKILAGGYSYLD